MNIDLIMKLIRLANNNPNDNEANLAARKACKMLENYKFTITTTPNQQPFTTANQYNPGTWEGFPDYPNFNPGRKPPGSTRETKRGEPETEKPKPHQDTPKGPYHGVSFEELYEEMLRNQYKSWKQARYYEYNPFTDKSPKEKAEPKYDRNKKRVLKCTKCKKDIETGFVGHPGGFVCTPCQWEGNL